MSETRLLDPAEREYLRSAAAIQRLTARDLANRSGIGRERVLQILRGDRKARTGEIEALRAAIESPAEAAR